MCTSRFRTLFSAACVLMLASAGNSLFARQGQPAPKKTAAKTAALSTAHCSRKGGDCCKGTPTRVAMLASGTVKQIKPVKNK